MAKFTAKPDASPAIRRMVAAANLRTAAAAKAGYKNGHSPADTGQTACPITNRNEYIRSGACLGCGQDVR